MYPLLSNGYIYKGFIMDNGELTYIIAFENITNDLYVLSVELFSTPS